MTRHLAIMGIGAIFLLAGPQALPTLPDRT